MQLLAVLIVWCILKPWLEFIYTSFLKLHLNNKHNIISHPCVHLSTYTTWPLYLLQTKYYNSPTLLGALFVLTWRQGPSFCCVSKQFDLTWEFRKFHSYGIQNPSVHFVRNRAIQSTNKIVSINWTFNTYVCNIFCTFTDQLLNGKCLFYHILCVTLLSMVKNDKEYSWVAQDKLLVNASLPHI